MFTPEFFIDTVQGYKKTLTNQIFKDETVNKAAHSYIDAQSVFAKMLVQNAITLTRHTVDTVSKSCYSK